MGRLAHVLMFLALVFGALALLFSPHDARAQVTQGLSNPAGNYVGVVALPGPSGSVSVGGTFNPAIKSAGITLSAGNTVATNGASDAFGVVIGNTALVGGRIFKVVINLTKADGYGIGVATTAVSLLGYLGSDANAVSYLTDGTVRKNGSNLLTGLSTFGTANDDVYLETSSDNTQVRFKKGTGGTWSAWVTHGLGATVYVAAYVFYANTSATGTF